MSCEPLIILSGKAGSGKTTIGRLLATSLNYEFVSMGNFSRNYARDHHGMDINQFQDYCKPHPEMDAHLDDWFVKDISARAAAGMGLVLDYRLGVHFFPGARSFFLEVSDAVAACRVAARKDETGKTIEARNQKMRHRLLASYGFDFTELAQYDLKVITDTLKETDVVETILASLKNPL
ncbi:MAG: AAA family ATPase [Prosthecobacter sp.]|uniref:AAA family ATPase n=1 Tax=Prosthecobacter sp. TaxID=1965333 RepID=UPI0026000E0C|nr:AAA family ATPase [Prosthecobacter sp.]MCF7786747.1 AAA family ATPase [Prosthecobacter sp.]